MYMPSALPRSTTLVSPPTIVTPAFARAAAMARTSASSTEEGSPSSRMKVTTIAWPLAPETARSFIVPLTASSPIDPPGNLSGLTTKLSVVIAIEPPSRLRCAASPRGPIEFGDRSGAKRPSTSLRLALPPAPCAISICGSRKRTTGRTAATRFPQPLRSRSGHRRDVRHHCRRRLAMFVVVMCCA